ncbi:MAG: arsenite methyltransferase [Chloroflexi bacterium]|nr:arsenite methyltransferase [Chloroflexota bacterium]
MSELIGVGEIREAVRERYARSALEMARTSASCCDDVCTTEGNASCGDSYSKEELASLGLSPQVSLGCGNPTALAELHPGETVLDLGSGAGIDVLLSARRVSPGGHAYGVDMTDEMLAVAKTNQERAGVTNATFLKGTIEALPLPDASVDVIISNCVINLAADKAAVMREAFRVLRPGGRLAIADMVAIDELPAEAKRRLDLWAGCISGTITRDEYSAALRAAGFSDISFETVNTVPLDGVGEIASDHIRATRPPEESCC